MTSTGQDVRSRCSASTRRASCAPTARATVPVVGCRSPRRRSRRSSSFRRGSTPGCCSPPRWAATWRSELALTELVSGARGGRDRAARPVPPAAHVRDRGARRRRLDLRVVAGDGHLDRDDRPPLRASRPRLRGLDQGSSRRQIESFWRLSGVGSEGVESPWPRSRINTRFAAYGAYRARTSDPQLANSVERWSE